MPGRIFPCASWICVVVVPIGKKLFKLRDVFYLLKEYAPNVDKMVIYEGGSQGTGDIYLV
jgi:hypothetical protein